MLPWRQYNGGEGCYYGDGTVKERGVTMETVRCGGGVLLWGQQSVREGIYHRHSTMGDMVLP